MKSILKIRYLIISGVLAMLLIVAGCNKAADPAADDGGDDSANIADPKDEPPADDSSQDWVLENPDDDNADDNTGDGGDAPDPVPPEEDLSIDIDTTTTSGTVVFSWDVIEGATSTKVYASPEPIAEGNSKVFLVATLDGSAETYTLGDMAPEADIFTKIVIDAGEDTYSGTAHAKTKGGPRATLDNSVREVHAYAPNILQVVVADGSGMGSLPENIGTTLKSGTWTVGRLSDSGGDPVGIAVTNVYRHSIPVSADDYSLVGDGSYYNINSDDVTAIDHRIYLVLDEAIGSLDVLSISGPLGINFILPFSDKYLETPVIQLNQVGYNPRAERRWAYVSGWMGNGGPLSLDNFPATVSVVDDSRETVLENLSLSVRSALDVDAGTSVKEIDLSTLPTSEEDTYYVRIPGVGVSWPTRVSEWASFRTFYLLARGMFFNRWGGDLRSDLTQWSRPADHPTVFTAEGTDPNAHYPNGENGEEELPHTGERSLVGGYHDAGDFDQRPMHTVVPELLMRAYELNTTLYKNNQLNIPESGNGIPDLLDEALWGVAAWEQLQEDDGGVRMGVETYGYPRYLHADQDTDPYWTFAREKNTTARAAGIFAQASRLIQSYNSTKASELRTRAINAYTYAKSNGASDYFLFYGASELYRLTGNSSYRDDFENMWKAHAANYWDVPNFASFHLQFSDYTNGTPQGSMPDYWLAIHGSDAIFTKFETLYSTTDPVWNDQTIRDRINVELTKAAVASVDETINSDHAHRNPRRLDDSMDWGYGTAVNRYLDTVVASLQMNGFNQDYFDALSLAADYVLGGNPNGMVYISGLGSRHTMEILHTDSLVFEREGKDQMPGIPVYGPVDDIGGSDYLQPTKNAFYPVFNAQPLGLRYGDTRPLVPCNEFTIWEMQAPLTQLFGILIGPNMVPADIAIDDCGIDYCDR